MIARALKATALATALFAATAAGALAQGAPTPVPQGQPVPPLTTDAYVRAAAQFDEFAAQGARLAQTASSNAEVRAYAQRMIGDHGESEARLRSGLQRVGMAPPADVRLTAVQYEMLGKLKLLQGRAFDEEYAQQAVISNRLELGLNQEYVLNGDNQAIKTVAMQAVPVATAHVRDAENMVLTMRPPKL